MIDRRKIIKISPLLRNLGEWVGRPQSNEDVSSHSVSSMRHGAHWSRGRPRGVRVNDVTDVIVRSLCTAESKEKLRSFLVQIGRIYNWARRAIHRISSAVPPIMPVECSYGEKKGGGRTKARVNTENLSRASAREADPLRMSSRRSKNFYQILISTPLPTSFPNSRSRVDDRMALPSVSIQVRVKIPRNQVPPPSFQTRIENLRLLPQRFEERVHPDRTENAKILRGASPPVFSTTRIEEEERKRERARRSDKC